MLIALLVLTTLHAQQVPQRRAMPDSALRACQSAAKSDVGAAQKSAKAAETFYRTLLKSNEKSDDARILLARVLSECIIEHASLWSKTGIVKESNSLLHDVLARDSTNWEARFTLAMNYYHAPSFFGWRDNAIAEFEHLLAQQRDRTDFAEQALPFLYLGNLYEKKGEHDKALVMWRRGSALFPDNVRLRDRAAGKS